MGESGRRAALAEMTVERMTDAMTEVYERAPRRRRPEWLAQRAGSSGSESGNARLTASLNDRPRANASS